MASFDEHLSTQLNQRDADEAASVAESNAENYREMCSETARLASMVEDLAYCKNRLLLDKSAEIAEIARNIGSFADAMQ